MDFYFITSFINMVWQIFTILFVLYRFTSFFSMMYNFILFLGKLLKGVYYIKDQVTRYIAKKRGYSYLNDEQIRGLNRNNETWFDKIKSWIFGKPRRTNIPLYETRTSFVHNISESNDFHYTSPNSATSPRSSRPDLDFENTMMNSSQYESSDFYVNRNLRSSIYPPPPNNHRRSQSHPSIITQSSREVSPTRIHVDILHPKPQKPFNVENSNLLLNSQFLTTILQPFSSEDTSKEVEEDNESELEKALLNSDYNEV